ncbi:1-deoxy-D-xylulose-5-phosphate synthase [Agathobaculum sp.]|uniref:1-deoxy-D-xylulose-5-phosphate synthase n=1 Tax=Agathobaculum sp. TaxID=2048138 RepID=UPI003AEFA247
MYLEHISGPADVKKLSLAEMTALCGEIRTALIEKLSRHGGHCGPNFGFVEATVALHYVFDSPKDKMVFDVSHQTYPHKMLTGRAEAFLDPAHYDDVSGYSNPHESEHDHFTIGHTSTSVSLACGLAKARDLRGESGNVIAVIGDGSLSGGEALEALDYAAELDGNLIIIVNDNDMSIAENHGGIYGNLRLLRETGGKAECNLFRAMGLDYRFVADGNDLSAMIEALRAVKDAKKPVVLHIVTEKGKGFAPAEQHKEDWHYCAPFDRETGKPLMSTEGESWESITTDFILERMKRDPAVCMITSGTPTVLGFTEDKRRLAGRQFIDVGIAEENAVALASGIAAAGGKPVYGVYSTFIQRTYDQLSQDLCINNSPATIIVAWGSVYGMNDVTHLGLYDIPMMSGIPNLVYLAPTSREEYLAMLDWSIDQTDHPIAIRMPGGPLISTGEAIKPDFSRLNEYQVAHRGAKVALLGLGSFFSLAQQAAALLKTQTGIDSTVINPRFITGLDEKLLRELTADHDVVVTLEDGQLDGGFGEKIARFYGAAAVKVLNFGLKKEFLDRYDLEQVLRDNHLTPEQIAHDIRNVL